MREKTNLIVITICGLLFAYVLYQSYHYDTFFAIICYVVIGGIGIRKYFWEFIDEKGNFKNFIAIRRNPSIIIGTTLILLNFAIFSYYEIKINAKSLLKTDYGNIIADFKTDNNYIIKIGSWASKKHFYGKYSLHDSVIILDRSCRNNNRGEISNKLVIRKYGPNSTSPTYRRPKLKGCKTYLMGIDKNENDIKYSELVIIEDNR